MFFISIKIQSEKLEESDVNKEINQNLQIISSLIDLNRKYDKREDETKTMITKIVLDIVKTISLISTIIFGIISLT
jgi:two-component sensor histidine kinase